MTDEELDNKLYNDFINIKNIRNSLQSMSNILYWQQARFEVALKLVELKIKMKYAYNNPDLYENSKDEDDYQEYKNKLSDIRNQCNLRKNLINKTLNNSKRLLSTSGINLKLINDMSKYSTITTYKDIPPEDKKTIKTAIYQILKAISLNKYLYKK